MLKLNDNPPLTWPDTRIRNFNGTWRVAHCMSRNEKALAWDMVHKKFSYFLPMNLNAHESKGRTFKTLLPLFPGYVFFCGNELQRLEVLRTKRVANIINVENQAQLVHELEAIENTLIASFTNQSLKQFGKDCSNITEPFECKRTNSSYQRKNISCTDCKFFRIDGKYRDSFRNV